MRYGTCMWRCPGCVVAEWHLLEQSGMGVGHSKGFYSVKVVGKAPFEVYKRDKECMKGQTAWIIANNPR